MIFNCSIFDGNHCSNLDGSGHLLAEREMYYVNSDNKISNNVILSTAQNAYKYESKLECRNKHTYKINKDYWLHRNISAKQAIRICKKILKYEELAEVYDWGKSVMYNLRMLHDMGIKVCERSLRSFVADAGVVAMPCVVADDIMQVDDCVDASFITPLFTYDNTNNHKDVNGIIGANPAITNNKKKEGYVLSVNAGFFDDTIPNDTIPETVQAREKETNDIIRDMLMYLCEYPDATNNIIADAFSISIITSKRYMKKLQDNNYITRIGNNRKGYWKVTDEGEKLIEKH